MLVHIRLGQDPQYVDTITLNVIEDPKLADAQAMDRAGLDAVEAEEGSPHDATARGPS